MDLLIKDKTALVTAWS